MTLRAAELLRRADIVFYDAVVHPDTLAMAGHADKMAVGKRCGKHSIAQRFINKRLIDAARRHAVVVRLKGGDPLLFGRALAADTCAVYMGIGEAERIATALIGRGARPDLPVVIVENATLPEQRNRVTRLADLAAAAVPGISGPAVILLGEVYGRAQPAAAAMPPRRAGTA